MLVAAWLGFLFGIVFAIGCAVGSFLNVCVYRLPRGKNLGWPSSRCGACLQPIAGSDNIPIWSYWRLRGRCRRCGATFSMRYFWLELATGAAFVALYLGEIGLNLHGQYRWQGGGFWFLGAGLFPPHSWAYFAATATLASLLLVAAQCLLEVGHVPPTLAATGAVLGLGWAVLYPWPQPTDERWAIQAADSRRALTPADGPGRRGPMPADDSWATSRFAPRPGFVPWPVWGPLPAWLPAGTWPLGLATGLAGVLLAPWLVRLIDAAIVRARGRAAFGADLPGVLLLAGGFLGWQPLVAALSVTTLLGLPCPPSSRRFSLMLVGALFVCWQTWAWLGPLLRPVLFDPRGAAGVLVLLGGGLLLLGERMTARDPVKAY